MKKIVYDNRKDMTKKAWKELQKSRRVVNGFNTGTRTMKSAKYPSREENKRNFQKMLDNSNF